MSAADPSLPHAASARRAFERSAATPAQSVAAHEAARRMDERLEYVTLRPQRILDAGCGSGADLRLLRRRYPDAEITGADAATAQLRAARPARSLREKAHALFSRTRTTFACADMAHLPFREACFDLVWSNVALPWASDASQAFREFARVLAPRGLLSFCTYGPDTLKELRNAFAAADAGVHVHRFVDMHDLGDMLVAGGFAAPVMDMERITLTYTSLRAVVDELRSTGQVNVAQGRARGLMSRAAWQRLVDACERQRVDGRIGMTVELVFGHAWKPEPSRRDNVAPIRFHR